MPYKARGDDGLPRPNRMSINETTIEVALTPRHGCPAKTAIWPKNVEDVHDFESHSRLARKWMDDNIVFPEENPTEVRLYVTGLTPLTAAFLNEWTKQHASCGSSCAVKLILLHWNRDTSTYEGQLWQI